MSQPVYSVAVSIEAEACDWGYLDLYSPETRARRAAHLRGEALPIPEGLVRCPRCQQLITPEGEGCADWCREARR